LTACIASAAVTELFPEPPLEVATAIVMGVCFHGLSVFHLCAKRFGESIFLDRRSALHAF
jgi:hypothetical protein